MSKYTNKSKLMGKIGSENYRISDCPFHIPKENVKFFKAMLDAGNEDPFSTITYSNLVTPDWRKKMYESIMNTVSKEVKKALKENVCNFDFNTGFIFEDACECGGVSGSYNTPMNTVGVGNVVPASIPAISGSALASDNFNGSGDIQYPSKLNKKKKHKTTTYFPIATKK